MLKFKGTLGKIWGVKEGTDNSSMVTSLPNTSFEREVGFFENLVVFKTT